jgi:hypothetical protein
MISYNNYYRAAYIVCEDYSPKYVTETIILRMIFDETYFAPVWYSENYIFTQVMTICDRKVNPHISFLVSVYAPKYIRIVLDDLVSRKILIERYTKSCILFYKLKKKS